MGALEIKVKNVPAAQDLETCRRLGERGLQQPFAICFPLTFK